MPERQEPLKVQVVGHVDSNYPDAWRTRQDYIDDQRKAFWLFVMQIVTLAVAIFAMVGTYMQVAVALKSISHQQQNAPSSLQLHTTQHQESAPSSSSNLKITPQSASPTTPSSRP